MFEVGGLAPMGTVVAAIFLFAGFVKGFTGLGFITMATVPLVLLYDVPTAIALVFVSSVLSNAQIMFDAGDFVAVSRRFWPLYAAALPGLLLGTAALALASPRIVSGVLGVLLIGYALFGVFRPNLLISERFCRVLQIPVGGLHGFFAGMTGSQVMPLLPYLMSLGLKPREVLQASNTLFTICGVVLVALLWMQGLLTMSLATASLLCLLPTTIGVVAGCHARHSISSERFKPAVLTVLFSLGLVLVYRASTPRQMLVAFYP